MNCSPASSAGHRAAPAPRIRAHLGAAGWWLIVAGALSAAYPLRAQEPQRLAVASPDVANIVRALEATDKVAAADAGSIAALARHDAPRLIEMSSDALEAALRQAGVTMILGDAATLNAERTARVRAISIDVVVFAPATLDELFAAYRRIGELLDRRAAAERLVRRTSRELAQLSTAALGHPRPRVAVVLGREPITVPRGDSLVTDIVEIAGGETVLEDLTVAGATLTAEALAAREPAIVIHALASGTAEADPALAAAWWREKLGPIHIAYLDRDVLERWSMLPGAVRTVQALLFADE